MRGKIKRFGLSIKSWLFDSNNLRNIAYIVAIVALIFTAVQASLAKSELEVSRADLEARTRPYLSIENILVEDRGEDWISIMIGINNYGEIPATRVQLEHILMGGKEIVWTDGQPYEDYPATNYTTEEGVTIRITGGLLVAPGHSDFPADMIFFPQKLNIVEVPAYGTTWRATITEGSVMDIGLTYFWEDRQYEYVATAVLSDGEWRVILERGD